MDFEQLGKITRKLLPVLGKPNISKTSTLDGKLQSKTTGWKIKGVEEFVKVYQTLKDAGITIQHFEQFEYDLDFGISPEVRMDSFYTSDDPQVWRQLNELKNQKSALIKKKRQERLIAEPWSENDKIREVNTKLTGVCTWHDHLRGKYNMDYVDGICLKCEELKRKRNLPNHYHSLIYKNSDWHRNRVATTGCLECVVEKEFNEKYDPANHGKYTIDPYTYQIAEAKLDK